MTILSKLKTLIEYAKCGMGICQIYKFDADNPGDLYFPQNLDLGVKIGDSNAIAMANNLYVRSIKGRAKTFGAYGCNGTCKNMLNLEEIDLPECTSFYVPYGFGYCTKLHTVKLSALKEITCIAAFEHCTSLKYIEFGSLAIMGNQVLLRCTELETVVVGKDTTASLYLHYSVYLTQECLHNIIDNLADMTGRAAPTLQIGSNNIAKLSDEYKTKLSNKNWNLA